MCWQCHADMRRPNVLWSNEEWRVMVVGFERAPLRDSPWPLLAADLPS